MFCSEAFISMSHDFDMDTCLHTDTSRGVKSQQEYSRWPHVKCVLGLVVIFLKWSPVTTTLTSPNNSYCPHWYNALKILGSWKRRRHHTVLINDPGNGLASGEICKGKKMSWRRSFVLTVQGGPDFPRSHSRTFISPQHVCLDKGSVSFQVLTLLAAMDWSRARQSA